jgi:hypothetical protein
VREGAPGYVLFLAVGRVVSTNVISRVPTSYDAGRGAVVVVVAVADVGGVVAGAVAVVAPLVQPASTSAHAARAAGRRTMRRE